MNFVHLHTHSHYSLLKALPQIDALVHAVKEQGMDAVALTDNGALYGAIEFYETCRKEGVKPIIGCELYTRVGASTFHLTALAEHYEGYKNLMRLVSAAALDGLHDTTPCVTDEMLARYHHGIIFLSGCKQGELAQIILSGDVARATVRARELMAQFGEQNFFLELQDHPDLQGQFQVNEGLQQIAQATGLPLVVTRDVHYLTPDDAQACDIVECIGAGHTVHEHAGQSLVSVDRSLSTPEQIQSRWRHLPDALENTARIAARVNVDIPLNVWHFPPIEKAPDKSYDDMLREQAYAGITSFLTEVTAEMRQRIEYELGVIKTKGYAPYFLAVADYIKWARDHGIVTTTRGSAAGSLVSFAIGIVSVNPLYFKLPFERFLNPFRPSPPDVDGDFADDRREEVIAYVTQKYGRDRVAQIITFGTMAARASVRDAGRALGFSYGFCDRVAKLIPFGAQGMPMTIDKALVESPDLKKIYDEQEDVRRLLDIARKIEGNARHTSIHAAGVVIAPEPLTEFTPVQYEVGGTHLTTQYEMNAVEKSGVLKMDFLGIRNLSILGNAVELVRARYGVDVDLQKIPWDDKKTYDMLTRGETGGVFQLNGAGMTRYLKELKPTNIFDIMAMVALFRPGPMDSIPEYIRRKHDPSRVTYLDERLHKILDQSLGILVYQDDVLLTAIELAGYNWEEADKFRKAMGKKIPAEMAKQKLKFFAGCLERGLSQEKIEILWHLIEPFAAYGFGKAHAASYAVVAYQTAYLKANYPVAYMCAVLAAESDDTDKISEIVHECERMRIRVLPPDINESREKFSVVAGDGGEEYIRFGLSAVKNVGEHITQVIIAERDAHGPFVSLVNFLERVHDKDLNKKSLESLTKCGAFDAWGDRGLIVGNMDRILAFSHDLTAHAQSNQTSLLGMFGGASTLVLQPTALAPLPEKLMWEKELIGLYLSSHPFKPFAELFTNTVIELSHIEAEPAGATIALAGLVADVKKKWTKNREPMALVRLEDLSSSAELLVFPKTYAATEAVWQSGVCVCVIGQRSREDRDGKIFVEHAQVLTEATAADARAKLTEAVQKVRARAAHARRFEKKAQDQPSVTHTEPAPAPHPRLIITLPPTVDEHLMQQLKGILATATGTARVRVRVQSNGIWRDIDTDQRVEISDILQKKISDLLGSDCVRTE